MSVDNLEDFTKEQLIEELINRTTFVGLVIFHRSDAKQGQLEPSETVMTKSPPLDRQGTEVLLGTGQSLVSTMFEGSAISIPYGVPLRSEDSGAIRIGGSRVLLELVIHAFQNGATPEAIVQRYDSLDLRDVYAVIAYYLRHRDEVEEYLKQREQQAVEIQELIESKQPDMSELRQRLLAQRQA